MKYLRTIILSLFIGCFLFGNSQQTLDSIEVSLLICSPGKNVYELEGHAGLRLRNITSGYDVVVNYGLFDFNSPNFIYRFVKGETDYMAGACDYADFKNLYLGENRIVKEWPLNLTLAEANRLVELVSDNLRPENRTYRYNYVLDNCSTRPVRMIELAVGDSLVFSSPAFSQKWSFRDVMCYYHKNYPWYQFGIDLALGSGIDYELNSRSKIFAPVLLDKMVGGAYFNSSGRPLVLSDAIVCEPTETFNPDNSKPLLITPMCVAIGVLVLAITVAVVDIRRRRVTKWVDTLLMGVYGLTGCVLCFLVFVSEHEATSPNWLLLWMNPFCLIIPTLIYIKRASVLVLSYEIVNFVALLTLGLAWPWLGQTGNMAFLPLAGADMVLTIRYIYLALCTKRTTVS